MGKKSSPDPPQPVQIDPEETAAAQFKYGKKAALYNKQLAESTFQETPYGSLSYENIYTPIERWEPKSGTVGAAMGTLVGGGRTGSSDVPITKMIQKLHPAEQRLLDQQRSLKGQYGDVAGQLMGKASDLFSSPVDTSSLGPMPSSAWDFDTSSLGAMPKLGAMPVANEATRQSMIDSILGRYQPQQAADRSRLETQLANQGFVRGSSAWDSAMDEINRREHDFRLATNLQAGGEMRADLAQQLGARGQSFQEQMGMRGQGLQEMLASSNVARANLAQQLGIRQQNLQELLLPRNQTLQELSTFMSGSQPTMPQFKSISAPQVSAPNYAGLAAQNAQMQNQANMAAYNAQMQNQGGGLGGLLGTAAGAFMGGPGGAALGSSIGGMFGGGGSGGVSTFSGAIPGAANPAGGWSFG